MSKVYLLDCTLRDGGYVNSWRFGEEAIKGFSRKIAMTGIELYEVGFLKGDEYDPDCSIFPDVESFKNVIEPKNERMLYVGMLDMSAPVPISRIPAYDGTSIDVIRVIFKKDKLDEAFDYCKKIMELGYKVSVNFVSTDLYGDDEFIAGIRKFNEIKPYAMAIVDTFGLIKRKQFLRLCYIADNSMHPDVILSYHAHNNLQQAFGNAEALVEMNLKRDISIDACVFGMGRGAGNLNLELFADYMNENYNTDYRIEPMLEIMDEYLNDIFKEKFWGYSLPLYLSATAGVHPNYAIYLAERNTLTVKSFNEILGTIPKDMKERFSRENAEKVYKEYQEKYVDDRECIERLSKELAGKTVVMLAPGKSLNTCSDIVNAYIEKIKTTGVSVIAVNCIASEYEPEYLFSSNMRRFSKMQGQTNAKCIITSNMKEATQSDYVFNFSSYSLREPEIIDNAGLMMIKILCACDVKKVAIAGMDGYSADYSNDYYDKSLEFDYSKEASYRNALISEKLSELSKQIEIEFITETEYWKC